jgi:ribonucleoside-diphosphate reductase alpha chain
MQIAPISQQIWDMKYRLKGPGGDAVDKTIEESWQRVAASLAEAEPRDRDAWRDRFAEALRAFRFLPAGRILSGAGTDRKVTLFNCFVMGDIPDDMAGIFEQLKEAAVTMQQGGGIGYDFSTLRPKGAPVKGVGADASGPLSFMDVWDSMCRTIMSAGSRRGAMMAVMSCSHPDIEAFIEAKREAGRLRMFNLSVLISDAFMEAVKKDESWTLSFNGTHYKTLQARELWDKIMRATYAFAEPGVIFIDRINRLNNLHYCETIHATNPCITADSWIHTSQGPRRVADLLGRPFTALVNGEPHGSDPRGFFATGHKPVLALSTKEGHRLRLTGDHPVRKVIRLTRDTLDWEWCAAGRLTPGDRILLNDHRGHAHWDGGAGTESEGYLLGLLIGDGTLKQDDAILSVWKPALAVNGDTTTGADGVMEAVLDAVRHLPRRADFRGWMPVTGRQEWRLKLRAVHDLATRYGLAPGHKTITPAIEADSADFYRGLLRGLFDTDGSIQGTHGKGISVRLAQSDEELLRSAQRMLLRLGIVSTLYPGRNPAMARPLPDGRGSLKLYEGAAQHELVISGANLLEVQARIGFADYDKASRLDTGLRGYRRALNREHFTATIESLTPDGDEAVFDASIPGLNAFDANGLVVHNCGEQPLPPYGVCLLGSINLARLVTSPFTHEAALDEAELAGLVTTAVRMLDNVIDISNYPLEQHRREAYSKRRIGLGVTGLADALIECRVRYGSPEAVTLTHRWLAVLRKAAYLASAALAEEKGPFPLYDPEQYLAGETIRSLEPEVQEAIRKHGIRNALVTSIAPTGTISLFADNVSSGLEPVFSFSYSRNILMPDGTRKQEEVSDYALRLFRQIKGESAPLPDYFVDAQSLSPADHVVMQATVQKYIDSSISKTINVPEEIDFEAFKDVYLQAYEQGCKGCTTYRPNDITGAVLEVKKEAPAAQAELPLPTMASTRPRDPFDAGAVVHLTQPLNRPEELPGATYKVRWPDSDHAMYITLNDIVQDGRRRPFEVFINSKNMDHFAWTVALTRMISAVFRRGGDVAFVVEELKAVFDPRGGQWMGGRYVPSLLAAIGDVIERHMISIGFIPDPTAEREGLLGKLVVNSTAAAGLGSAGMGGLRQCPKCAQPSLVRQEGCDTCTNCGYSKCG